MLIYKVLGSADLDFVSKDGTAIKGTQLFVSYPDNRVTGVKADKFFCSERVDLPDLKPGMDITIAFNRYGKVEAVTIVK